MTEDASRTAEMRAPEWPGIILHYYLSAIGFIIRDTARDPKFTSDHLLSYLADDFVQSAVSISTLAREGGMSVAKRELRFIIESSIKICYVQQHRYASSVQDKLTEFEKQLASPNITIKRDLRFGMLPPLTADVFNEEVGRLYGRTSGYVHLTPSQILERIAAVDDGRTVGRETAAESDDLRDLVVRGFAVSLVLLLHSVPEYVAGDWLVNTDGSTVDSYFVGSKYIAAMDAFFDYKAEHQARIEAVKMERAKRVHF
jgi:hypothetical protein